MENNKFQSWNSQQKKYVLFEGGKITGSSPEKYPGVSVKKDKPSEKPEEKKKDPEASPEKESGGNPFLLEW